MNNLAYEMNFYPPITSYEQKTYVLISELGTNETNKLNELHLDELIDMYVKIPLNNDYLGESRKLARYIMLRFLFDEKMFEGRVELYKEMKSIKTMLTNPRSISGARTPPHLESCLLLPKQPL